jgi:PiT family inorganic phosphate transporter
MELNTIESIEQASRFGRREMFRLGFALLFIVGVTLYASTIRPDGASISIELVVAAMIGGYMAMNIGAN